MLLNGGAAVAHAQPGDQGVSIGRPVAFRLEITPPPPSDRLHPGQPDSARPRIGRPVAFQSPSVLRKDTSKPREIPIDERRWFSIGKGERNSNEPKMTSKEFTRVPRSEPHFHDVDGACQWSSVTQKVLERFTKHRPEVHRRTIVGTIFIGETWWYINDDCAPAYVRDILQGHRSRPTANPEFFKNMMEIDECNLSFNFPAVPRQNSAEWIACRRNKQERRKASMLLVGRASSERQGST